MLSPENDSLTMAKLHFLKCILVLICSPKSQGKPWKSLAYDGFVVSPKRDCPSLTKSQGALFKCNFCGLIVTWVGPGGGLPEARESPTLCRETGILLGLLLAFLHGLD